MDTQQQPDGTAIQTALCRVALSLDAFLLNGIPYGVLEPAVSDSFLEKAARDLRKDLADLEEQTVQAPASCQPKVRDVMAALREGCEQLIEVVTGLASFRALPLEQVRASVSQIPLLRESCVRQIQELESCLRTPKPFYQSRPAHSTAAVNDFLDSLVRVFTTAWNASRDNGKAYSLSPVTPPPVSTR